MNSVRSNNLSLKYQRITSSGSKYIGFIKFEFGAKTQFICTMLNGNINILIKKGLYGLEMSTIV